MAIGCALYLWREAECWQRSSLLSQHSGRNKPIFLWELGMPFPQGLPQYGGSTYSGQDGFLGMVAGQMSNQQIPVGARGTYQWLNDI